MKALPVHVFPWQGQWNVSRAGARRASGLYESRDEALAAGRALAEPAGAELFLHGDDGRVAIHETAPAFAKTPAGADG